MIPWAYTPRGPWTSGRRRTGGPSTTKGTQVVTAHPGSVTGPFSIPLRPYSPTPSSKVLGSARCVPWRRLCSLSGHRNLFSDGKTRKETVDIYSLHPNTRGVAVLTRKVRHDRLDGCGTGSRGWSHDRGAGDRRTGTIRLSWCSGSRLEDSRLRRGRRTGVGSLVSGTSLSDTRGSRKRRGN